MFLTKDSKGSQFTFLVTVVDTDKTRTHDQISVTITDGTSRVIYHQSAIVKGHIEIHKILEKNPDTNKSNNHNQNNK